MQAFEWYFRSARRPSYRDFLKTKLPKLSVMGITTLWLPKDSSKDDVGYGIYGARGREYLWDLG